MLLFHSMILVPRQNSAKPERGIETMDPKNKYSYSEVSEQR